jgi:hypothetical protein
VKPYLYTFTLRKYYCANFTGRLKEWKGANEKNVCPTSPQKWKNKRGNKNMKFKLKDPDMKATEWIILSITLILGVILVPIVVDQVQTANTTDWTFTGYSGAKTLFLLLPFIFIVGIVLYFILAMLGKV